MSAQEAPDLPPGALTEKEKEALQKLKGRSEWGNSPPFPLKDPQKHRADIQLIRNSLDFEGNFGKRRLNPEQQTHAMNSLLDLRTALEAKMLADPALAQGQTNIRIKTITMNDGEEIKMLLFAGGTRKGRLEITWGKIFQAGNRLISPPEPDHITLSPNPPIFFLLRQYVDPKNFRPAAARMPSRNEETSTPPTAQEVQYAGNILLFCLAS